MSKRIEDMMVSNYRPKNCDFSASSICMPDAQIWAMNNTKYEEDKDTKKVGLASFIGSAVHSAFEGQDIDGVVQELSWVRTMEDGTRIGGTADRLDYIPEKGMWELGDYKVKGDYAMKKFLGINSQKSIKEGTDKPPETEKEIIQMSIYRWLFKDMFKIKDEGFIYLIAAGHVSWAKYPAYQEYPLQLISMTEIDKYIKKKIKVAKQEEQPDNDCSEWMCNYCAYTEVCKHFVPKEEDDISGFQ